MECGVGITWSDIQDLSHLEITEVVLVHLQYCQQYCQQYYNDH